MFSGGIEVEHCLKMSYVYLLKIHLAVRLLLAIYII